MKTIHQDELYQNLSEFLKSKGVEMKEGSYTLRIRQGCGLLTEVINMTQQTVRRAKVEVNRNLDQLRQTIHEATAPDAPSPAPAAPPESAATPSPTTRKPPAPAKAARRATKSKTHRPASARRTRNQKRR
jgi:hypothetical protein